MTNKGICEKHGEFNLFDGCPQCLDERGEIETEAREQSAMERLTGLGEEETEPECGANDLPPIEPIAASHTETALVKVKPEADRFVIALHDQALKLQEYAEVLVILNDGDVKSATNDLSIISGVKKAIEERRKEYTQPINDHLKTINNAFKTLTEPLDRADRTTRNKVLFYRQDQERQRLEALEINRLRMEAAQKEMELKGELSESVDLVEVIPEVKRVSTDSGTVGMTDHWTYEVVDFALLPDTYKIADGPQLTTIARSHHDKKQIPGVRFYNEPIIAVRAR